MVAGLFGAAGYFQGTALHPPRPSNPRGFFEDAEINDINETLLRPLVPPRRAEGPIEYLADSPRRGQHWLARIPLDREISVDDTERRRIQAAVSQGPFCLKDPRLCYTLHVWRHHAPQARMICVFRHPQVVVASILREIAIMPYLEDFALSVREAFEVWRLMYSHVLQRHARTGEWLFVEYQDVFRPSALDRLADFADAAVDRMFPAPELDRSQGVAAVDALACELYKELIVRSKATLWR